jgi:uncharacterized protein
MGAATPHDIARAFIAASEAGAFPDGLCCPDMTAWTTLQPEHDLAAYGGAIAWMRGMTGGTLKFVVDAITAEDDRVAIEAHSHATLANGSAYANTYVFVLRLRDGRIASVREHYNAQIVSEKLIPLMRASRQ